MRPTARAQLKRPVKWTAERIEEFLSATHGRDLFSKATLALDEDGRILALRVHSHANLGAYATPAGAIIQLMIGPWVQTGVYDIHTIDVYVEGVLTNTTPTGPYRGAGRPEAIYTIERLMDAAARQTGIDPVELRRRNMVKPAQMPYQNAMGKTYDTGQFESVMNQGVALADWKGFDARAAESRRRGRLRGRGMATFVEWTGAEAFSETVTVTVKGEGEIEIFSATQAMGQGLATTFAQLAVDVFGVPLEKIRIALGDTDRGTGFGSAGSRSLFVGGSAVHVASERHGEESAGAGGAGTRGGRRGHRVSRWRVSHRWHRSRDRPLRPRRQAARAADRAAGDRTPWPIPRGPTAATSAKSKSIRTPARSRSSATGRSTMSVAWSIR